MSPGDVAGASSHAGLAPLIVGLPLLSAAVLLFFGKRLGNLSGWIASAAVGGSFLLGLVTLARLLGADQDARTATVHLWDWIASGEFRLGFDLTVDELAIVMVLVVTGVGALIHVYSVGYMEGDPRYSRFFAYLNLFAATMLLLVLADNVVLLYVGWEGVGLCSYLLIGFWFEKPAAHNAAKKAFFVNRVGDVAFLLGVFVLASAIGSLTIGQINEGAGALGAGVATAAALLLFGGATGKSAQIPLYVWLPDAMEGPTPVSALIHAATMVTAGVYMVVRLFPVFEASGGTALMIVAWIGALTALWAALLAAAEYDIKRVLAYSTVSQLGYMFLAAGVGAYAIAIFHLVTHAFFKAAMFLSAGAVMHGTDGETDMRALGGLRRVMPVTAATMMAGGLALSGIVPFAGFFSKDAILASAWEQGDYALWGMALFTAGLTAYYMSRLYFSVFEGRARHPEQRSARRSREQDGYPHDPPLSMAAALLPLAALSLVGGAINLPGVFTLDNFLERVVGPAVHPTGVTVWLLGGLALVVAAVGIAMGASLYLARAGSVRRRSLRSALGPIATGAQGKFYVDEFYGRTIVLPGKSFAAWCSDVFDARGIDGIADGIGRGIASLAEGTRRIQTGYVRNYALAFLVGVIVLMSIATARLVGG